MANPKMALQFWLISVLCLSSALSYKLVHYDPYSLATLMSQPQQLVAVQSQQLLAQPQTLVQSQVPTYKDTEPIKPRHMEHVDLKAYESAVISLLTEVDKKDRAPHRRTEFGSRSGRQVDVSVNVHPYVDVKVKKGGHPVSPPEDGGVVVQDNGGAVDSSDKPVVVEDNGGTIDAAVHPGVVEDNGGTIDAAVQPGVIGISSFKPLNLGINIPIGIGVLTGWSGVHVAHDPTKQVSVQVGQAVHDPNKQVSVQVGQAVHDPNKQVSVQVGQAVHDPTKQVSVQVGAPTVHSFHYYK